MTGITGHDHLAASGVTVRLGGVPVLHSVSVSARAGEVTGVIGPNGAGKSTLLRVLAGVLRADAGAVRLGGADLHGMPANARARRVAYLPQQDAAQPFTALETVLMGRYPYLRRFQLEGRSDRRIAHAAMVRTETERFARRSLDRLSGGERQRVLLARALAQQADVLVLDEPLASLDLRHRLAMMAALRDEAARDATVVVALHDVELAGRYCDRLVLLALGAVAGCGTPLEVLVPHHFRAVFGVEAVVSREAATGEPRVWLLGPSERDSAEAEFDGSRRSACDGIVRDQRGARAVGTAGAQQEIALETLECRSDDAAGGRVGPSVARAAAAPPRAQPEPHCAATSSEEHAARMRRLQAEQRAKVAGAVDPPRGLVLVHTGNGKGKSSAAFGVAARALGWGQRVGIVQFIKGKWQTGEQRFFSRFPDQVEWHATGQGFTWDTQNRALDVATARTGLDLASEFVSGGRFDLVVLDEINVVASYDYLPVAEIIDCLEARAHTHVLLTGRGATAELIEYADLVSEMVEVKHPFQAGIKAQRGIDF